MMLNRRRVGIGMAIGLSGLALVPLIVTRVENHQAGETARLLPDDKSAGPSPQRTAVVFFSRSGNTALLSRHLARRLDASLFRLKASDYDLGFIGWVNAMRDAGNHETAISPRTIDLAGHDAVYLGSPIWMYSPAPPIWQFVEHHRFDGQRVVLFNTFNSRFKPEYVETSGRRSCNEAPVPSSTSSFGAAEWAGSALPRRCWRPSTRRGRRQQPH